MDYQPTYVSPVVPAWLSMIESAIRVKRLRFQPDADEGMRFFSGPYDFFFRSLNKDRYFRSGASAGVEDDTIVVTINKVAELVQIFGPALYHANPVRTVTPRQYPQLPPEVLGVNPVDPMAVAGYQQITMQEQMQALADGARGTLLQSYLNYTPSAYDLKTQARRAIDEALIKGAGCLWTEPFRSPSSPYQCVGSFYDSVDNLVIDPDATTFESCKWIARRVVEPVWRVERKYNLPPGYLKPNAESTANYAAACATGMTHRRTEDSPSQDLLVYWVVYSKMGVGGRLTGPNAAGLEANLKAALELFGDYCSVAVTAGCNHPLNLPPWVTTAQGGTPQAVALAQWPTPYWADGAWPCTLIRFHEIPGDPWPMSHITPAMGELKFLNWLWSKLSHKIRTTSRDLIACSADLAADVRAAIKSGKDLEVIVGGTGMDGKRVSELVEFIQHPQWNGDIWQMAEGVMDLFDRRTGLTELLYGISSRQLRSAAEAQVKTDQASIRPDDMAEKVEQAMTDVARRELLCARWHLSPDDVRPVLGGVGAAAWQSLVYLSKPEEVLHNLETRVEAGSSRKPNKATQVANMQQMVQLLFQPLYAYAQATGNVGPVNAIIADYCDANDVPNAERYLLPAMPPPLPPAPAEGGGPPQ